MGTCSIQRVTETHEAPSPSPPQFSGVGTWVTEQGCGTQAAAAIQALPLIAHPTRGQLGVCVFTRKPQDRQRMMQGRGSPPGGCVSITWRAPSHRSLGPTPPESRPPGVCPGARESALLANSSRCCRHSKDEGEKAWLHRRVRREAFSSNFREQELRICLRSPRPRQPAPRPGRDTQRVFSEHVST